MTFYQIYTHCPCDAPDVWGVRTKLYTSQKKAEEVADKIRKLPLVYDGVKIVKRVIGGDDK